MAVFHYMDKPLIEALSSRGVAPAKCFSNQDLVNALWSVSALVVTIPRSLIEALSAARIPHAQYFNHQNLSNSAWAFARLSLKNPPLLAAIAK